MRTTRGWKKNRLAAALGMQPGTLYEYERGDATPSRQLLDRAAAVMGFGPAFVDRTFAYLRQADADLGLGSAAGADAGSDREIDRIAVGVSLEVESLLRAGLQRTRRRIRAFEERQAAQVLWARLAPCSAKERQAMVREGKRFQTWALSERLCDESIAAAPDNADRALELADLAVLIARLAPGTEAERARIQAYALTHLGNAHRVHGDLPASDAAFTESAERWKAGGSHNPDGLLNEARMLGLEASLRRDQRLLPEALDLLDRALAADWGDLTQQLLINRAKTLEESGDYEQAVVTLRRALPLIHSTRDPQLLWDLKFNLAEYLYRLNRRTEAEALLAEVRQHALQQGNDLNLVRLVWLQARIDAGFGKLDEAEAGFEQVRTEFLTRGIAYDTALVSLELAVLLLEQGRQAEVKSIVHELLPVFKAQRVNREALAAVGLFRDAVEHETVTVELACRCLEDLRRTGDLRK
jgi:tetratricopeptide (TPR) repeat protein